MYKLLLIVYDDCSIVDKLVLVKQWTSRNGCHGKSFITSWNQAILTNDFVQTTNSSV
jgi:hypothetical protein